MLFVKHLSCDMLPIGIAVVAAMENVPFNPVAMVDGFVRYCTGRSCYGAGCNRSSDFCNRMRSPVAARFKILPILCRSYRRASRGTDSLARSDTGACPSRLVQFVVR